MTDTDCPAVVARVLVTLERWLQDLQQRPAPTRFAVIDEQLQEHLQAGIDDLKAIAAANQAKNQPAEDLALQTAISEKDWLDTVTSDLSHWSQVPAALYVEYVGAEQTGMTQCTSCAIVGDQTQSLCFGADPGARASAMLASESQVLEFQGGLLSTAAPNALADKANTLQIDLASADTILLALNASLMTGDKTGFEGARPEFQQALHSIAAESRAITGGS